MKTKQNWVYWFITFWRYLTCTMLSMLKGVISFYSLLKFKISTENTICTWVIRPNITYQWWGHRSYIINILLYSWVERLSRIVWICTHVGWWMHVTMKENNLQKINKYISLFNKPYINGMCIFTQNKLCANIFERMKSSKEYLVLILYIHVICMYVGRVGIDANVWFYAFWLNISWHKSRIHNQF